MSDEIAVDADTWYSADATTFGDRMAGAREVLGMTQSELAKRLGVKLKTVRAWEDDLSEPRANKLQTLAGVLNVSIMWLLNGAGQGVDGPGEEHALAPEMRELLTELRQSRGDLAKLTERIGVIEKRLRAKLREGE